MVSLPINLREIKMKKSSSSSYFSQKRTTTQSNICFSYYFIPLSVLICLSVLYGEDFPSINIAQPFTLQRDGGSCGGAGVGRPHHEEEKAVKPQPFIIEEKIKSCDIFAGKWVYDEASTPYYTEEECPYLRPELTCQEHGRPDKMYQHWRWQPHNCSLPSFNSTLMLEKLRGKRMLFVGDSLNRGQFISMVCLLHGIIPETAKSFEIFDSLTVFTAKEYNATVEFYWAPFLVESNADDAVVHRIKQRIVRIGCIKKHAKYWKGSDIIVFNSYVWWMTGMPMQTIRGPFSKGYINDTKPMQTVDIYRITMRSVLKWVKKNMNPLKTRVFFTSMSPAHEKSMEWGGETKGNCFNETKPIEDPKYWGEFSNKTIMKVIGDEFKRSKLPITFINITQLSEYRKDAHTTIYKKRYSKPLTPKQIANPKSYADCIHWCLPGLQDTWNQLLYTKLFFS